MIGKLVFMGISLLVVAFIIVVGIFLVKNDSGTASTNGRSAIDVLCDTIGDQDDCVRSLGLKIYSSNATPKLVMNTILEATAEQVANAFDMLDEFEEAIKPTTQRTGIDDCRDFLKFADEELDYSLEMVESISHSINETAAEVLNWLNAVISYFDTCVDSLKDPEVQLAMDNGLEPARNLAGNALALMSLISGSYTSLNALLSSSTNFVRPDKQTEIGTDKYPTWLSAEDIKLVEDLDKGQVKPNVVVAQDGTGNFSTIGEALNAYPVNNTGRYVIYVKEGHYSENVTVTKGMVNVFMYGDGPDATVVAGWPANETEASPLRTALFAVVGKGFIAKSMGFNSTADQALGMGVALRVQSDMSAFFNCKIDGYHGTLYAQTHRQFYQNCVISGAIDFIFGDSTTLIQNSDIIVKMGTEKKWNIVTAHGRSLPEQSTGFVIKNSRIVPDQHLFQMRYRFPTYLGRPRRKFSRVIIMQSTLGGFIHPEGWTFLDSDALAADTLLFAEYANHGLGADTSRRVKWRGYNAMTSKEELLQYTSGSFAEGTLWSL